MLLHCFLICFVVVLVASHGHAQSRTSSARALHVAESDTLLSARLGPYYPHVDRELEATPFRDTFGSSHRVAAGFDFETLLWNVSDVGSVWFGVGAAYTRFSAKAPFTDGSGLSAQETYLAVLPIVAAVRLRGDVLVERFALPVAPYARGGFGHALWWTRTAADGARERGGPRTLQGHSSGLYYAGGVLLLLDALDQAAARTMAATSGVEHAYLGLELYALDLGRFWPNEMRVGTRGWSVALTLEM